VLGVPVLAGCLNPPPPPMGPAGGPLVGGVGDSLTYHADKGMALDSPEHYFADDLGPLGYRTSVAGTIGANTRDLPRWGGWAETPSYVFVALGTNDRHVIDGQPAVPLEETIANVEAFLDRWAPARPVLVGIVESSSWGLDGTGPAWNDYLEAEAAERGGCYLDWWAIASQHPEWYAPGDVHPNGDGQAAYRAAIVAKVQECS
jgi:lysophospholipase L1-like esterase